MKLITLQLAFSLFSANQDTLYIQPITYQLSIFKSSKGTITISEDSVYFKSKNSKKVDYNFSLSRSEITAIKKLKAYIFPNRLLVKTTTNSYILFSYRRKKLIENLLYKKYLKN